MTGRLASDRGTFFYDLCLEDHFPSDQQLRIDRRTCCMTAMGRQLTANPAQLENRVDAAQKVIRGHPILEAELIEQTVLPPQPLSHHGATPQPRASAPRNHAKHSIST